ncbi:MAG: hypothetical protein ACLQIQ_15100 [Beijerinckiaceae bacterium]
MPLQELYLRDIYPNRSDCAGNLVGWFEDGGKIYFDQSSLSTAHGTLPLHQVNRVQGTKAETLCEGVFQANWTVKPIGSKFE